jgi:hypothetical protein
VLQLRVLSVVYPFRLPPPRVGNFFICSDVSRPPLTLCIYRRLLLLQSWICIADSRKKMSDALRLLKLLRRPLPETFWRLRLEPPLPLLLPMRLMLSQQGSPMNCVLLTKLRRDCAMRLEFYEASLIYFSKKPEIDRSVLPRCLSRLRR